MYAVPSGQVSCLKVKIYMLCTIDFLLRGHESAHAGVSVCSLVLGYVPFLPVLQVGTQQYTLSDTPFSLSLSLLTTCEVVSTCRSCTQAIDVGHLQPLHCCHQCHSSHLLAGTMPWPNSPMAKPPHDLFLSVHPTIIRNPSSVLCIWVFCLQTRSGLQIPWYYS